MNEKFKTRTDAANYRTNEVGRMGRRDGGTDGWDAGGRGGRDPKPTLTLICADPKPYALWNTSSPAFKV